MFDTIKKVSIGCDFMIGGCYSYAGMLMRGKVQQVMLKWRHSYKRTKCLYNLIINLVLFPLGKVLGLSRTRQNFLLLYLHNVIYVEDSPNAMLAYEKT